MVWIIDDLADHARALSNYISQALEILIDCLFYPINRIFYWLSEILKMIMNAITGIIDSLWYIYEILIDFLYHIISSFLPYTLLIIVFIGLTIMFLFRIYHFVKEISILGNKL